MVKKLVEKNEICKVPAVSDEIKRSARFWCSRYEVLFRVIDAEDDLRESLKHYSVYKAPAGYTGILHILSECLHDAYEAGVVVTDYREITEAAGIQERSIFAAKEEWAQSLTADQLLACMAWHFRADHFNNGSWISESVAGGAMLVLVRAYLEKCVDGGNG